MQQPMYTATTGELARQARVTTPTIRLYADLGLLEFVTASDGTKLFKDGQVELVRQIYERRMANRGRRPAA